MKNIIPLFVFLFLSFLSNAQAVQKEIRGTWITNVASDAMLTPNNVKQTVLNCKKNGLTDIFVVVWNGGVTM